MELFVPIMNPGPGQRARRFVGDRIRFTVKDAHGKNPAKGWRALLRTNLGRAEMLREEALKAHAKGVPFAGNSWRDIPMTPTEDGWFLDLALAETGYFKAKAYLLDPKNWQHWPEGSDVGIAVHPDFTRTANTLYCAFPRMFGPKTGLQEADVAILRALDAEGYAVIPPSGKLRDLTRELPHIVQRLGCRILHLLPVNPVPTTYARFGRFGSPYAALDLAAIDPALVEFDKRTTGVEQFQELTYAAHLHGARVILDIVVNHTGWGSVFQENHPEWYLRHSDGQFKSPGAWGVIWEDLVELKHTNVELWDCLSDVFLTWCRRGVDGFRCDAGYMVPMAAWQYIIARVQQEFPNAIFLLEGLGGAWEATENLLTEGGMQWAYSELFQNYAGPPLAHYLDHSLARSRDTGLLVHYSETHDNPRLAERGKAWSLMRNRLCALASDNGGFGFTCGVEWLATEKILVHGRTAMNWGAQDNIVEELARLNNLLASHPCFFDGAQVERISAPESPVLALLRTSAEDQTQVLVLANTNTETSQSVVLSGEQMGRVLEIFGPAGPGAAEDLLGQPGPKISLDGQLTLSLAPAAVHCLGLEIRAAGEEYRKTRARAAWATQAIGTRIPIEQIPAIDWRELAEMVDRDPVEFLARVELMAALPKSLDPADRMRKPVKDYTPVVEWTISDVRRVVPVPAGHWVLVRDPRPFRAKLTVGGDPRPLHLESTPLSSGHIAAIPPRRDGAAGQLELERYDDTARHASGALAFLPEEIALRRTWREPRPDDLVLLTNGRGGMARIPLDLGRVNSKYDCVLGANLHPEFPVDRHVFVKRIRVWVNADGFISPLTAAQLVSFEAGPPASWRFVANAGDGRTVEIEMRAIMVPGKNTTLFRFARPTAGQATGKQLPAECDVRLTIRVDIEDRGFHSETHRNGGADYHFTSNTRPLPQSGKTGGEWTGFEFTPAADRSLRVYGDTGSYHPQEEWCQGIPHPVEQSRGQVGHGDAFSPGWFEMPLAKGQAANLIITAETEAPEAAQFEKLALPQAESRLKVPQPDSFARALALAADAFIARRGAGKTVIAGYPWFLDWGRDTFIAARGLIAAGWLNEVGHMLRTFARFEKDGTLPNTIFGADASNRDTSDAPLWFGVVAEELLAAAPHGVGVNILSERVDPAGRTLRDILESIADNYIRGTPNGIRMDAASGLIWSPPHFTWMDTNYPAATPREGYPVEIQALWIRLLRFLGREGSRNRRSQWKELATQAAESVEKLFWLKEKNYYSDVLPAPAGTPATNAVKDDALRSNACFLVSLGISSGERARLTIAATARHLLVPGALRSLAPLPLSVPLPVRDPGGRLLNDPMFPYCGRYEGDEDTRRKPAYHNGTAWVWTLPSFCEGLARAWDFSPGAVAAAKAYLGSTEKLLREGCIGHLPEILDGDAPHTQRGCDAQAWSVTETLRVWLLLQK